jgi:hypothetical protein
LFIYPDQGVVFAWTMNTTGLNTKPFEEIGKLFVEAEKQRKGQK